MRPVSSHLCSNCPPFLQGIWLFLEQVASCPSLVPALTQVCFPVFWAANVAKEKGWTFSNEFADDFWFYTKNDPSTGSVARLFSLLRLEPSSPRLARAFRDGDPFSISYFWKCQRVNPLWESLPKWGVCRCSLRHFLAPIVMKRGEKSLTFSCSCGQRIACGGQRFLTVKAFGVFILGRDCWYLLFNYLNR